MQGTSINAKASFKSTLTNLGGILLLFAVMLLLIQTGIIDNYFEGIVISMCINIILAASLNITTGFLGQIALGHAGFMSIGAYSAALFAKAAGSLPDFPRFILSLLIGGIIAALFGVLVGIPALRLKGDYLAIITLGFGEIIRVIIENLGFTGGAQGLRQIPKYSAFPAVFLVMILCVCILYTFVRSRHGRAITAIREDDIASEASGLSNTYYKVLAFTVASFFAGVAGGVYAQYIGLLSARSFNFMKSIDILVIVVLGGMGSLTGSIVAAIGLTILPELLRGFSDYRMLVYSVALIVVMIFKPSGLFGRYEFSLTRALRWIKNRSWKKTPASANPAKEGNENE